MDLAAWTARGLSGLLLTAGCLLLSGCGVEGEPLPPLLNVPERTELHGVQRGNKALLAWALPPQTTEGQALRPERLGPSEVYRAMLPGLRAQVTPQDFEAAAQRVAQLPPRQVEYSEELPPGRAGDTAAYAVRLLNRHGDSAGFSNILALPVLAALPAPGWLRAQPSERFVLLEWPAVAGAAAYQLYRAEGANPWALLAQPVEPRHADERFEFGKDYRYLVRAVVIEGAFHAESADSPVAAIRPEDVFPPAVPAHLVAIPLGGASPAVALSWDPNAESDLAGYHVFRSEGGGRLGRLNSQLLLSPTFRDTAVKPGASYAYAVSAVDQKGNESARSEPAQVQLNP